MYTPYMYIYTQTHTETRFDSTLPCVLHGYARLFCACDCVFARSCPIFSSNAVCGVFGCVFCFVCDKNEHTLKRQFEFRAAGLWAGLTKSTFFFSLPLFDARALNQSRAHIDVCFGIVCSSLLCRHRLLQKPHKRIQTQKIAENFY